MKRKALGIASSLVPLAIVIGALWVWRSRAPGDADTAPAPAAASAPDSSAPPAQEHPAHGQVPAKDGAESAGPQQASAAPEREAIPRKPTLGLSSLGGEATPEELERNREVVERSQKAWDTNIAPLLYPPGHPLQGTYLDGVTLDQAVEAQLRFYEEISPPGSLDVPWLHIQKRIDYDELAERRQTWSYSDLASNRELYDWILEEPEDPSAPPGDFWLPAHPSDKDATTRREFLRQRIRAREAPILEKPAP